MPKATKATYLNIQLLNDFLYTVLYNASAAQKAGLAGKYLAACENLKSAQKFINSSTREEKEYLLAHFGYHFFYTIGPYRASNQSLKQFLSENEWKKGGFYIHSDKELMHLMGLASKAVHNGGYGMNLEILRQGYHIKKWPRKAPIKDAGTSEEAMASDNILMRTLLSACITMNYQSGITGVSEVQMYVLLYLYVNRNKAVSFEKISDVFAGYKGRYTARMFKSSIVGLLHEQCIHRSSIDQSLTITSLGIQKCQAYRESVLINNTNF